ncbi:hypothetical protein B0H67DRAFT_550251 [Lasiosphaeris hirsuta]|uniref:Uncharacterized protein n=1 Tax=Lasiosphaeris hirsuta TaxID=260670 RepID=A0AA40AYS3_9PEZI|nr:hypothetical protein B0H67DRAFT_550251 [Lasiosphaeris hirsuta]
MFSAIYAGESPPLGPTLEETLVPGGDWYYPEFYLSALGDPFCAGPPDIEMPAHSPHPFNLGSSGWTEFGSPYATGSLPPESWPDGTIDPRFIMQGNPSSAEFDPSDCIATTTLFFNNTFDQPFGESYDSPLNEYDPATPPSLGPSTPDQYDDQVYGTGQVPQLDYTRGAELDFLDPQASAQLEALLFASSS